MDIYLIIKYNMDTILTLDESKYPELCRPRRKKILSRLYMIMEHMLSYDRPAWKKKYFLFSNKYLADWCKTRGGPCDTATWQSLKIFFLHTGLLKTFVVIGKHADPVLNRNWEIAQAKKHRTETLWTVPYYTEAVLQHAEEIAREYTEKHVNISKLRKNVFIRVWGIEMADDLYKCTGHIISQCEWAVYSCLVGAMRKSIASRGYTTDVEIATVAKELCIENFGIEPLECVRIINILMQQKRYMIDFEGYSYHRQRKKDCSLGIPGDYKGYIITSE